MRSESVGLRCDLWVQSGNVFYFYFPVMFCDGDFFAVSRWCAVTEHLI